MVAVRNRPHTAELYAATVRLHLKPALGSVRLSKLTVSDVQTLCNRHLEQGRSVRAVQLMRSVLRTALSRAVREELVVRNVAKLVDLPAWERKPIQPWTAEEAGRFLAAAQSHRWYAAFVMLLLYGMRRGEVLGLRWCDVDFARDQLHIRQQLQRLGQSLQQGPVKTAAGRRDLPLIPMLREALAHQYVARLSGQHSPAEAIQQTASDPGLVFLSSTGTPIDPKNFVRTFHEMRSKADLPRITVHHTRHTAATMLKNLGVPARDAQLILGHAHITTTQQLYQHADLSGQAQALTRVEQQLLAAGVAVNTAVKQDFSTGENTNSRALAPGGPGGARTLDTLLKRLIDLANSTTPTPVIRQLRTRAYARIVGRVAVKNCCQTTSQGVDDDTLITDYVALLHALRHAETDLMRTRSFPLNLIPATPPHTSGPAP